MLTKRIIPCLDVKDGVVVKGVKFRDHEVLGDIVSLARRYAEQGADELVFYDITASAEQRLVDTAWVERVAKAIDIPFCVAGGIRSVKDARAVLHAGADKISINSPAHERPALISELADAFGVQCVVIGIDSKYDDQGQAICWKYTGSEDTSANTHKKTLDWVLEVQKLGAGEIVLNAMDNDGMHSGYAIKQLSAVRAMTHLPLIASGGAGQPEHFIQAAHIGVDGMLAAGIFHRGEWTVSQIKNAMTEAGIAVRPSPTTQITKEQRDD